MSLYESNKNKLGENMLQNFNYLSEECHQFNESNSLEYLDKNYEDSKISHLKKPENTSSKISANFIAAKSVGKIEIIHFEDILWLHASSNYIEVHLEDRVVLHRESLMSLEEKLPKDQFIRVHRSSIVNMNKIKLINSELGRYNLIALINDDEVKLSKAYRNELFHNLGIEG